MNKFYLDFQEMLLVGLAKQLLIMLLSAVF